MKDQKDDQIVDTAFQTLIFWMRMISTNVKYKNINNKFILLKILKKKQINQKAVWEKLFDKFDTKNTSIIRFLNLLLIKTNKE